MAVPARHSTMQLAANLVELIQLALSAVPERLVRTEAYRRLRRCLSVQPERFESDPPQPSFTPGRWHARKLAMPDTDLVIEGFPGSGNSFVSNAVRAAIDRPCLVESHFHHTVQLKRALAFGVPTLVIVRQPAAACRSLKSKQPELWSWLIVLRWLIFHRCVARQQQRLAIYRFDDLIVDLGQVAEHPAVHQLIDGRQLDRRQGDRRPSRHHVDLADRRVIRWLMGRAERRYRQLFTS